MQLWIYMFVVWAELAVESREIERSPRYFFNLSEVEAELRTDNDNDNGNDDGEEIRPHLGLPATQFQVWELKKMVKIQGAVLRELATGQEKLLRERSKHLKRHRNMKKYLKKIYNTCMCEARRRPDLLYSLKPLKETANLRNAEIEKPKVQTENNVPQVSSVINEDKRIVSSVSEINRADGPHVEPSGTNIHASANPAPAAIHLPPQMDEGSYDVTVDLTNGNILGDHDATIWLVQPTAGTRSGCAMQGLMKLSFGQPSSTERQKKVLIDMWLDTPTKWVFNVGDSKSNDGRSGDGSSQENDCEAEGYGTIFSIQGSDKAPDPFNKVLYSDKNFLKQRLTLIISDETIVWNNHEGHFNLMQDKSLFALNGQSDKQGEINYDIYLAMNRVIAGQYRYGHGLCKVAIKWLK